MGKVLSIGLDVGSTTVKAVVLNEQRETVFKDYRRHYSDVKNTVYELFKNMKSTFVQREIRITVTGSAGLGLAETLNIPFVQEVTACSKAIGQLAPETDVAIELGGEDAKIMYFTNGIEQRMNGTCAGGTGAFIDQMASLLKTDAGGLNKLATNHQTIYPIASRCGVFAKTDIQPLLNEGANKADIAASVLQAVVNQTIGGLACGKPIRGKVAFLGGPLTFMPELKKRFRSTLNLRSEDEVELKDTQYFVAMGAAHAAFNEEAMDPKCLYDRIPNLFCESKDISESLEPLFSNEKDYEAFKERHSKNQVKKRPLGEAKGELYLGIDAGSTTLKVAAVNEDQELVFSYYSSNQGNPLQIARQAVQKLYDEMPKNVTIAQSAVTGYGEHLLKAALGIDHGIIETVAHSKAADYFMPGVDFILDIGGQDMKSLRVHDGVVDSIMLNEACSSGCGSFVETFANALNHEVEDFAKLGLFAKNPVDLGTRCTVFMNSRVKQAQKEGASVGDISSGIAISVVKNALFKVIRMRSKEDLGKKIVVQGGTFYNDAVLRAFERIAEKEVIRPDIAGIMGAFGAALIAKENRDPKFQSTLLSKEQLDEFKVLSENKRCQLCNNHCQLNVNYFSDGRQYITGNRCERGANVVSNKEPMPNMYAYKLKEVFKIPKLQQQQTRGVVGLPRVLNMYEDFPFWASFFTRLGYQVKLSGHSTKKIYELGMETIPSESVCYPAKLVHGHIEDLLNKKVDMIFYPSIPFNIKENPQADNQFNCPVVTSYPETIKANVDRLQEENVEYLHPFLPLDDEKRMIKRIHEVFGHKNISRKELTEAVQSGYKALEEYKRKVRREGERILSWLKEKNKKAVVLAGRPYHIDPEINHGIPELITSYGYAVLSEDAISHLERVDRPLNAVDQWMYHTRLYDAAEYVTKHRNLELVQLNSFGCGLDAVTADQVADILQRKNKLSTLLKIDEINNLGAARIRMRSLFAAVEQRDKKLPITVDEKPDIPKVLFTKEMKKTHTILVPQMSPIHFQFLEPALQSEGYNVEVLPSIDTKAIDEGLKYVNNDACYPSILVTGQMMKALNSGEYDLDKTALIISQTGGGCRATNYIAFIRQALYEAGMSQVPVISLSAQGIEKHPGFKLSTKLLKRLVEGVLYGDLFMRVLYKTRPYEAVPGAANALYEKWVKICTESIEGKTGRSFKENVRDIVRDFDQLPLLDIQKPKVGLVGEILVKFHPTANNNIVEMIEKEGAEAVMPDLMDFFAYSSYNSVIRREYLSGSMKNALLAKTAITAIEFMRKSMSDALKNSERFTPPASIEDLAKLAAPHLSLCHQTGEGWFLTAEMLELIEHGVDNIVCMQPFACLPNHITGKGMIKALKKSNPKTNIVAIDYDPGASEVNQLNRIKLMLSTAFENLNQGDAEEKQEFEKTF